LNKNRKFFCAIFTKFQKNAKYAKFGVFFVIKTIAKFQKIVYNHRKVVKSGSKWVKVVTFPINYHERK